MPPPRGVRTGLAGHVSAGAVKQTVGALSLMPPSAFERPTEVLSVAGSAGDTPMRAGCPGQRQDPGRRDVLSQMSTTEVLPCPILSPTPPCSPHPMRLCCSCRACWPPNDAAAALVEAGARWA